MDDLPEQIAGIPHAPGVYLYRDKRGTILYIGKAIDLSRRVKQYFSQRDALLPKTRQLVSLISTVEYRLTGSEFEALLLEAKLIRTHQPKYNSIAKDDKSPIYIRILTYEDIPHVEITHKPKAGDARGAYFGPFPSKRLVISILGGIRRSIPFCMQKVRNGRPCFYTHLGLCRPCPSMIEKLTDVKKKHDLALLYRENIARLSGVLRGRSKFILRSMQKEMEAYADKEQYEEAADVRKRMEALTRTYQTTYEPFSFESDGYDRQGKKDLTDLETILRRYIPDIRKLSRIECYDISNTGGNLATGSLVVLKDGWPDKKEYRKFRIKRGQTPNDTAMLGEVLQRRLLHTQWPYPDLLIVDGGKPQVHSAQSVLSSHSLTVPCIGLSKHFEEVIIPKATGYHILKLPYTSSALHILERARDEAHRFARSYHVLLRNKGFLGKR